MIDAMALYNQVNRQANFYQDQIEDSEDAVMYCIQGVIHNNDINNAKWSDWQDAADIMDVYLSADHCQKLDNRLAEYRQNPEIETALSEILSTQKKKESKKTKRSQLRAVSNYKARLKASGLVRKEVWIRPEHSERLKKYAVKLRKEID